MMPKCRHSIAMIMAKYIGGRIALVDAHTKEKKSGFAGRKILTVSATLPRYLCVLRVHETFLVALWYTVSRVIKLAQSPHG